MVTKQPSQDLKAGSLVPTTVGLTTVLSCLFCGLVQINLSELLFALFIHGDNTSLAGCYLHNSNSCSNEGDDDGECLHIASYLSPSKHLLCVDTIV